MELLDIVRDCLSKVNAIDTKIFNMKERSPLYDYLVIASVDVARQSNAVVGYIVDEARKNNFNVKKVSGENSGWVLVDLGDVVVNIFTTDERLHYNLEKLFEEYPQV